MKRSCLKVLPVLTLLGAAGLFLTSGCCNAPKITEPKEEANMQNEAKKFDVVKTFTKQYPALRLIGKRYTNADRNEHGSFSNKWGEWFQAGRFGELEKLNPAPENDASYFGMMRCLKSQGGETEYWIGMLFPADTPVPDGFDFADIPAGDVVFTWVRGKEGDSGIYSAAIDLAWQEVDKLDVETSPVDWQFEGYNCPRFLEPDADGRIILDYGIYVRPKK